MSSSMIILSVSIIIFLGLFFLPKRGLYAVWKRLLKDRKRVLIEDSLKHIYDCEYNGTTANLNTLAGSLAISTDKVVNLISNLEKIGLIEINNQEVQLTADGRSYALRVIRIHRLLERYMADQTSLREEEWHQHAEKKEHLFNEEEIDTLAAKLGNPIIDPHGDPIPTAAGELPEIQKEVLTNLGKGAFANIIHIEDEPPAVYAQIVAEGIHPGMQVRVLETTKERILFETDGMECVLAPIIAANISVIPVEEKRRIDKASFKSLASLKLNEEGEIVAISKACRGQQRRRLLDFGVVPGTKIKARLRSLGGDPTAYDVRGTTIAIRKRQAEQIYIKTAEKEN